MQEVDYTPIPGWYFLRESELMPKFGGPKAQKLMSDGTCHFDRDEVGKMTHKDSIEKPEVKRKKRYVCINASYSQLPKLAIQNAMPMMGVLLHYSMSDYPITQLPQLAPHRPNWYQLDPRSNDFDPMKRLPCSCFMIVRMS
jgi:hypothetical protein